MQTIIERMDSQKHLTVQQRELCNTLQNPKQETNLNKHRYYCMYIETTHRISINYSLFCISETNLISGMNYTAINK